MIQDAETSWFWITALNVLLGSVQLCLWDQEFTVPFGEQSKQAMRINLPCLGTSVMVPHLLDRIRSFPGE